MAIRHESNRNLLQSSSLLTTDYVFALKALPLDILGRSLVSTADSFLLTSAWWVSSGIVVTKNLKVCKNHMMKL